VAADPLGVAVSSGQLLPIPAPKIGPGIAEWYSSTGIGWGPRDRCADKRARWPKSAITQQTNKQDGSDGWIRGRAAVADSAETLHLSVTK
jgi:hypothetical protein